MRALRWLYRVFLAAFGAIVLLILWPCLFLVGSYPTPRDIWGVLGDMYNYGTGE